MEENLKQLLIKDLCSRLPDGVIVTDNRHGNSVITEIDTISYTVYCSDFDEYVPIEKCKPYLRPMSSMTEEEAKEIAILHDIKDILSVKVTSDYIDVIVDDGVCSTYTRTIWYDEIVSSVKCFDFLTAHHFDYRGLIEKSLALEAPNGIYNLND